MKKILKTFLVLLVAVPFFISCESDKEDTFLPGFYISVATIEKADNGQFYLKKDDGETIYPRNMQSHLSDTLISKRAWFEYKIYADDTYKEPNYDVTSELASLYPTVWTKPYLKVENPEQNDTIGYDLSVIRYAWISGKYLNIGYYYWGSEPKKHDFNLVQKMYGLPVESDGKIKLEFRHNDNENNKNTELFTVSSFDISDFIPTEGKETTLVISFRYSEHNEPKTFEIKLTNDTQEKMVEIDM